MIPLFNKLFFQHCLKIKTSLFTLLFVLLSTNVYSQSFEFHSSFEKNTLAQIKLNGNGSRLVTRSLNSNYTASIIKSMAFNSSSNTWYKLGDSTIVGSSAYIDIDRSGNTIAIGDILDRECENRRLGNIRVFKYEYYAQGIYSWQEKPWDWDPSANCYQPLHSYLGYNVDIEENGNYVAARGTAHMSDVNNPHYSIIRNLNYPNIRKWKNQLSTIFQKFLLPFNNMIFKMPRKDEQIIRFFKFCLFF